MLIIKYLEEENNKHMEKKKQIKYSIIAITLTLLPFIIYAFYTDLYNKYFDVFSGSLMYLAKDNYFSFSPTFILEIPLFLPPILWALSLWLYLKVRKDIENRKSFFNYSNLVLIVLNSVFLIFSIFSLLS